MTEIIRPNLRTSPEDYSSAEKAKLSTKGLRLVIKDITSTSNLSYQMRDQSFQELSEVAETLAKSYGIYLEFNRAKTGSEKDWMYMVRVSIPGGGPISRDQWEILDDISDRYTESDSYTGRKEPSLRITTRQNIQFHWVRKKDLVEVIQGIARSGFYTMNGCGDNVRNTMGCPLSRYSKVFDANALAQRVGKYFRLPSAAYIEIFQIDPSYMRNEELGENFVDGSDGGDGEDQFRERGCGSTSRFEYGPNLLNRKFKIGFSAFQFDEQTGKYVPDNCVELRTDDIGIAPILEEDGHSPSAFSSKKVTRFQVYIGGSQGEKAGHATFAALGVPFGIFSSESNLLKGLDAIVRVHEEWGDRQNRHWARLKYVIYKMGIKWYRDQVRDLGVDFDPPFEEFDYGKRMMHHGWTRQEKQEGLWSYGAFIENGRILNDGPNGQLKKMVRYLVENYPIEILTTPNQDLIFGNIPEDLKERFVKDMEKFGYGFRNGKKYSNLRILSGACVGRDTCRLAYTDSEKFEPYLIDLLEQKWGRAGESIGVTGCEKQCFRPATKTIGWVGSGFNMYMLKIGGTEDAKFQGGPLIDPDTREIYLKTVPRNQVAIVTDALFEFYFSSRKSDEELDGSMGYFFRRIGPRAIIEWLKKNPNTAQLMTKPVKSPLAFEDPGLVNPSLVEK
jgi:sulfite reductase beta subunit-like hemoprotein